MAEYTAKSFMNASARLLFAALAAAVVSAGCGGSGSSSPSGGAAPQTVADGTAYAYVNTNQNGVPNSVGVKLKAGALDNSPNDPLYPNETPYTLPLPANTAGLPFRSVTLFTTAGQGPAVYPAGSSTPGPYTVPHVHVSFSLYTTQQRTAIGSRLWNLPASIYNNPATFPSYFDSNFDLPVDPYYVPVNSANTHYVDYSSTVTGGQEWPSLGTIYYNPALPELNTVVSGQPAGFGTFGAFTTEVDYAFFAGSMSSINMTSNLNQLGTFNNGLISTRTPINITVPLDLPQGYQTSGYYPTNYSIKYDVRSDTYTFELGGLVYREATDVHGNPLPQVKGK